MPIITAGLLAPCRDNVRVRYLTGWRLSQGGKYRLSMLQERLRLKRPYPRVFPLQLQQLVVPSAFYDLSVIHVPFQALSLLCLSKVDDRYETYNMTSASLVRLPKR